MSSSTLNAEFGTFAHVSQLTGLEIKIRKQIIVITWIKHFEISLTFSVNSIFGHVMSRDIYFGGKI